MELPTKVEGRTTRWGFALVLVVLVALGSCDDDDPKLEPAAADAGALDAGARPADAGVQCPPGNYPPKGCYPNCPPPYYPNAGECGSSCPTLLADSSAPFRIIADEAGVAWNGRSLRSWDRDGGLGAFVEDHGALAMNATNVYWGREVLMTCPRSGCSREEQPRRINPEPRALEIRIRAIALDATTIYYADAVKTSIESCPLAGCGAQSTTVVATAAQSLLRDGDDLYWTTDRTLETCLVVDCGSTRKTLASQLEEPSVVAVDGAGIYWTEARVIEDDCTSRVRTRLVRLSPDGTTSIVTERPFSFGLALDSSSVYFVEDGWVVRCPKSGCDGAETRISRGLRHVPAGVAVDETHVYWTEPRGDAVGAAPKN